MTATPAEIANDLMAHYRLRAKSHRNERHLGEDLRRCAEMIRSMLEGKRIDGRSYGAVHRRMMDLSFRYRSDLSVGLSIHRGLQALTSLRSESAA